MTFGTGGCLCGGARYELRAPPKRVTICHCRFCQRATGSDRMILPVFDRGDVVLTGEAGSFDHVSEGSGKRITIRFCATCGTKLTLTFERWPGSAGIYRGTLDEPALVVPDPARDKVIFASQAAPGALLPAGYPTYEQHVQDADGAPCEALHPEAPREVGR